MSELDYTQYDVDSNEYKQTKQEHNMQAGVLKSFDSIVVISDIVQIKLKELFGITKNVYKISNSVDVENIKIKSQGCIAKPSKKLFTTLDRIINRNLKTGWGVGRNDDYYLENSSRILKKIINKMGISLEDTVIYGTSAGGCD